MLIRRVFRGFGCGLSIIRQNKKRIRINGCGLFLRIRMRIIKKSLVNSYFKELVYNIPPYFQKAPILTTNLSLWSESEGS